MRATLGKFEASESTSWEARRAGSRTSHPTSPCANSAIRSREEPWNSSTPPLCALDERHDVLAHHRFQQRFLAVEAEVERALWKPGALRHVVEARGGEALLDEALERSTRMCAGAPSGSRRRGWPRFCRRLGGGKVEPDRNHARDQA